MNLNAAQIWGVWVFKRHFLTISLKDSLGKPIPSSELWTSALTYPCRRGSATSHIDTQDEQSSCPGELLHGVAQHQRKEENVVARVLNVRTNMSEPCLCQAPRDDTPWHRLVWRLHLRFLLGHLRSPLVTKEGKNATNLCLGTGKST